MNRPGYKLIVIPVPVGPTSSCNFSFYRAACNADAVYSDEKAVRLSFRPSVRLSVRQTRGL